MTQIITIESINFDGEQATILFNPDNGTNVINLGLVTLPFVFNPTLLTPPQEVYGTYTILVSDENCPNILRVDRPTPTPTPTVTPTRTPTPTPTPTVSVSSTPTICITQTPTPTNTPTITPTSTTTPTPTPTWDVCVTPLPPNFTSTPTPTNTPTNTPTPTSTPTNTPTNTPTPTPTKSPEPDPPGIYYGKINKTSIDLSDIPSLTFDYRPEAINTYVEFTTGLGYGYILVPTTFVQPIQFRDSASGCNGFVIPTNSIGQILIVNNVGLPITYNIYRTYFNFNGSIYSWMCS